MNKNAWGEDERAEFDQIIDVALAVDASNTVRALRFREEVESAIQAHRVWARDVEEDALRRGYVAIFKQEIKRGTVLVSTLDGDVEKPAQYSRKLTDAEGAEFYQLAFFEVWTREQIADKRREFLKQRKAYDSNIALTDKLTAMLDAAETDDLQTAAAILGLSVEDWLERRAA